MAGAPRTPTTSTAICWRKPSSVMTVRRWSPPTQRDAAGRLLLKTLPDGVKVAYRYDRLGRLVSVDDGHNHPLEFEYDRQDRLITEHQGWGTLRYAYDACGQLKRLRLPDDSKLDYHHAKGGALTAIDLNGTRLTSHRFIVGREQQRQQGQLLSDYAYDDQGRLQAHAVSQHQQTAVPPRLCLQRQRQSRCTSPTAATASAATTTTPSTA